MKNEKLEMKNEKVEYSSDFNLWLLYWTFSFLCFSFFISHLLLMATTGSIFAAIDAGIIPAITPTMIQMETARIRMFGAINTVNPKMALEARVSRNARR